MLKKKKKAKNKSRTGELKKYKQKVTKRKQKTVEMIKNPKELWKKNNKTAKHLVDYLMKECKKEKKQITLGIQKKLHMWY